MSLTLKPYPAYNDAGLPWLDCIPAHWSVQRAKQVFSAVDIRSDSGNEELLTVSSRDGVVPRSSKNVTMFKAESYLGYKLCWPGDLVINSLWAWAGGLGFARHHGIISSAYGVYRPKSNFAGAADYLNYALRSPVYDWEFHVRSKGIWVSRLQLTDESFFGMPLVVPPNDEAIAIARFLKAIDGSTRKLVLAKRRVIELLNEQKAVIAESFLIRGTNASLSTKLTGCDWLPVIPADWDMKRNDRIFRERNDRGRGELPILVVSLRTGVSVGEEVDENGRPKRLIEDRNAYKLAEAGDIAYNMMRMWQGAVGVAPVDGLVSPAYVVARPIVEMNSKYFEYLFRTQRYRSEVNRHSRGIVSDRNRLYWDSFKRLMTPVPPLDEQNRIVARIEEETKELEASKLRAQREIALIREYRTRLITDVVTGKLDVRGVELPEIEDVGELEAIGEADVEDAAEIEENEAEEATA